MKLTPVKVRGKRGQSKAAKHGKRLNSITQEEASHGESQLAPQAKRAKIQHDDDAPAPAAVVVVDAGSGISSRPKRYKALPRLSQLPQEILERVFIASRNLALPLVNRELYHRLSSVSVRYQLVGAAFGPTWDAWYGLENGQVQSYDGWMSDADRIAGDPTFQSAILACSWARLPILLESFNVWIRQHANGRPYFFPAIHDDGAEGLQGEEDNVILGSMESKFHYDTGFFASKIADQLLSEWSLSANDFADMAINCCALLGQHLEVNPGAMIPDDLLAGPFFFSSDDDEPEQQQQQHDGGDESDNGRGSFHVDGEKYERLFWLVRGGACLQEDQTWEVSREGFRAILELIKEVANRGEALNSRGADTAYASAEGALKLAAGLFVLFNVLGVFSNQWPKYILQTSLAEVLQLIPTLPKKSLLELLLGNIAAALRHALRNNGTAQTYELAGCRWRRPALRVVQAYDYSNAASVLAARRRVHYCVGWQRALYLDTALTFNRLHQRAAAAAGVGEEEEEEEEGQGNNDGGGDSNGSVPHYATRPKVYRQRFAAYMRAVGADPRIVEDHRGFEDLDWIETAADGGIPVAGQPGAGPAAPTGIVAHEPWSDFGLD